MNETEKQNYIRLQTMKLQKLSNIIHYASQISYIEATNIRVISDYDSSENLEKYSTDLLFEAIDEYKTLLTDFGELK